MSRLEAMGFNRGGIMAALQNQRERLLQTIARAHRVYLTSGAIFRPTAELWIDKLTDEMLRIEESVELPFGRAP